MAPRNMIPVVSATARYTVAVFYELYQSEDRVLDNRPIGYVLTTAVVA